MNKMTSEKLFTEKQLIEEIYKRKRCTPECCDLLTQTEIFAQREAIKKFFTPEEIELGCIEWKVINEEFKSRKIDIKFTMIPKILKKLKQISSDG